MELFFLRLFGQKEKWTNGFISQNCCNVSKKLVFSSMFFFSSFLAKEKKNQKEKTRFLRQWGVSPRARGDKGYAPLTSGTSPVRARVGVCEHGALNYNLSLRQFIFKKGVGTADSLKFYLFFNRAVGSALVFAQEILCGLGHG
ncbi:MAG: hypothetical protein J6B12_02150 [Clostridia bacterium]|nr:hypothetical protein [Clostridia bacterium]